MPEDDADCDKLKLYWDYFFKAETGTYEKSTWLDLFLAEFLLQLKNGGQPKEVIKFCPISGVVSLVGCELLCGIHRVTSSVNSHNFLPLERAGGEQPAGLSADVLRKYVLGGVAWRCLVVLKCLGVEGLSCCRQLSSVLIWLFGELSGNGPHGNQLPNPHVSIAKQREPIHMLFSNKIWSKQKFVGNQSNKQSTPEKVSVLSRPKRTVLNKTPDSNCRKMVDTESTQSTESNSSNDDLEILNRSLSVKVVNRVDDFEYFNSPVKSNDDYSNECMYSDPFYVAKKAKPKADDYMTDSHREIINSDITPFEFTIIITDLLQDLCKAESSLSGSEGSQISVQCINFSLPNLCALQFGSSPVCSLQYSAQEVSRLKVELTELLIVSLDKVLLRSDLCAKLINNGILPMLLRILEDVIYKLRSRFCSKEDPTRSALNDNVVDNNESDNIIKFVFGIAYSVTAFFYSLLMQCRTVDKLKEFTEQFKLYADCQKGGLLKESIEVMVRVPGANVDDVLVLIKKLIESVGKLISGMKRVRSEVIHSAACPRSKHKICRQRVLAGMHHHHDVLGEANTVMAQTSPCCVSVLYSNLTSLLIDEEISAQSVLRTKILRVMLNCGVCCCISPILLMENLVRLMLTHCGVSSLCLTVLEHTVYGDLGASVLMPKATSDQLPCVTCEPNDVRQQGKLDSKYCSHTTNIQKKNVSSFLVHYNSLLQLDNHNSVLHSTVSHLLRITPKCRMEMKCELLFSVMYPTFIVAKHRYIIRQEDSAFFLTVSCLNIFTSLLNTVSFAEQFIQKGGLSYVLELVSLPEFSKQCCSILEIAIIVEIFKLIRENGGDTSFYKDIGLLSSIQMLLRALETTRDKCFKIYRMKLDIGKVEELCDLTQETEILERAGQSELSKARSIIAFTSGDNILEEAMDDYIEVLKNIWMFWKCCAGLCLYSPMFRRYLVGEGVFLDTYRMLKIFFYYLGNYECALVEMRMLIKILESLLTIQFAVSCEVSQKYKEASSRLVRAAFLSDSSLCADSGGVRAVCDMLIRVATTSASAHHVMPPRDKAKLPPLLCASESSELEASTSEDSSAAGASDHSELSHYTPDDGYEADVELGRLDTASLRSRRSSVASLVAGDGYGQPFPGMESLTMDCSEYTKTGVVLHPELCIIVVDILSQLIQKLLEEQKVDGGGASLCGVGVCLARACCARLSAACSRGGVGRGAPLRLVRRLLAGVADVLATRDTRLEELQRSILELVQVLASQSIESSELASYLQLFKGDDPPLALLLGPLSQLADNAQPNMPDCILCFPVDSFNNDLHLVGEQFSNMNLTTSASQSHVADNHARVLYEKHVQAGISSCWSRCGARCGADGAGWSAWLQGFSAVLWLRPPAHPPSPPATESSPDSSDELEQEDCRKQEMKKQSPVRKESSGQGLVPELAHVFSLGHEALMCELWVDVNTGALTFRLSRAEKVVGEASVDAGLPPQLWSCVAYNVGELVRKRKILIQITLFINGREHKTVSIPLPGILVRKVSPLHALVGSRGSHAAWLLAGVTVLRGPVLDTCSALYLAARGPNAAPLTTAQMQSETPNYSSLLTPDLLDCNIDWDQVFEMGSSHARRVQDHLLLTFCAQSPAIVNLYHQTVSSPTVFPGRIGSSSNLLGSTGPAPSGNGSMSTIPETLFVVWHGNPLPSHYQGLPTAAYMLGGTDVFLYLLARVVELEGSSEEQAAALSLLLRLCRLDSRLHTQLHRAGLPMLHQLLAAPACRLTHHLLKVFLDAACSSPVLVTSGERFFVMMRSDSIIVDPDYLVFLIKAWKELEASEDVAVDKVEEEWQPTSAWQVQGGLLGGLLGSLLQVLCVLLRPDHPARAFNLHQAQRCNLLSYVLLACKERFLYCSKGTLSWSVCSGLVELTRALVSTPPQPAHVALLLDLLLLMHQASDTFVTYSRANFYFLLTSETQASSEFNILNFMSKRKRKGKKKSHLSGGHVQEPGYLMVELRSKVTPTPSEHTSLESSMKEVPQKKNAGEEFLPEGESSLDSTKEIKGLINMHIKERSQGLDRKSQRSSLSTTSENSDGTFEESVAPETMNEQQLTNEYVVVDFDDVEPPPSEEGPSQSCHESDTMSSTTSTWNVVEGMLLLLYDVINMADNALSQSVGVALQPEVVVVLANHRSAGVRAAVVRVLAALSTRAPPPDLYYVHVAHQISLYPVTWGLAAACTMLVTGCDVVLEDQLDEEKWSSVGDKCLTRSPPLLALLPGSLHDVPLAHNLTRVLHRIIQKASLKMLSELALVEVVVRTIRSVGSHDAVFEGRDLIVEDLRSLLTKIAEKALVTQHNMQSVHEIHYLLSYVEVRCSRRGACGTCAAVRGAQCALYHSQLSLLERRLHSDASAGNYFTSVLSSAVSLGGEAGGVLSRSELAGRHRAVLLRAVTFVTTKDPLHDITGDEVALVKRLYSTLLNAVSGSGPMRPKWWVSPGAEWLAPLQELFQWLLSPTTRGAVLKADTLRLAYNAAPTLPQLLTPADPGGQRKLAIYLLCLLKGIHLEDGAGVELAITDWARDWALSTQGALAERVAGDVRHEAARLAHADDKRRAARAPHDHVAKVVFSREALVSKLKESAMSITRQVVDIQNAERKTFMEHLRRRQSEAAGSSQAWRALVERYTHEQALWHHAAGLPQSWELDPTEGPGRVRVRLRRCHLNIDDRFLKDGYKHKSACAAPAPPLGFLYARGGMRGDAGVGSVCYMARVVHVTVAADTHGDLLLSDRYMHFVPEEADNSEETGDSQVKVKSRPAYGCLQHWPALAWSLEDVTGVVTRRWCLREHAVEVFLNTGHAHLIAFNDTNDRNAFLKALNNLHIPNRSEKESLAEATNLWRNGTISNWDYLMRLNGLGGRSYNDLMQYPVLPFVLADYSSRVLDLRSAATFRDLSKPMAVQSKSREIHYIKTYNDLRQARREGSSPLLSRQPHHYASLYSNSGAVLHYLVRLPPYTQLFLSFQDNNFDMPDRTFHSLQTTWRLMTNDSPTDVKELIPEFFCLPEFLNNNEGLNLGVRQCGVPVEAVELPPWAPDARLFTLMHRHALESPAVTEMLPHWIDLVFGYKQTGQPAIDAINVFPACTYFGFEPSSLPDEISRCAAAAMVRTYGQTPRQLLKQPHPHAVVDLHQLERADQPEIWAGLTGGRWGSYCGSPSCGAPVPVTTRALPAAALQAVPAARTVLAATATSLIYALPEYYKAGGGSGGLCCVSWGHADCGVRLKRRRDAPPDLLFYVPALDAITAAATSCLSAGCPLVFGFRSGLVAVLRARGEGRRGAVLERVAELRAHVAPVVDVCVCVPFSVLLTASEDGRVVLWDLNTLSYVRTIPNRDELAVTCATVSDTLCDVAAVHALPPADGKHRSLLRVHTVNGTFVGSARVLEAVTAVCYSRAPEGVSVNCVAAALDSGGVKLFSSWDLRPINYIAPLHTGVGLLSITYLSDSQVLATGSSDGHVVCWESGAAGGGTVRVLAPHHVF